ncbi:ABC transporter permease [Streptosporangium sp. CA-115845]|uniref:ABC transporter permease n=1 Tax=Streptosporangium sp. CA-115845 TaxID=3240071 RepID=UPI003D8A8316
MAEQALTTPPAATAASTGLTVARRILRTVGPRLIQVVVLIMVVSTALFFLLRLTGDPARILAGEDSSPETLEQVRAQYGLDRPLVVQYAAFIGNMLLLDFGSSLSTGEPALDLVLRQLPPTLELAALATIVNMLIAIPIGSWLGARPQTGPRRLMNGLTSVAQGIPAYIVGLLLIQIFAVWLGVLPSVSGGGGLEWILPSLTLAAFLSPQLIRVSAANVSESMNQDYVRTARATGAGPATLLVRHVLPNALLATTALLGAQFAYMMSGSMITEFLFSWPGLGLLLVNSVTHLDFPVVQASVCVVALLVFAVNVVMDSIFQIADPRLRRGRA